MHAPGVGSGGVAEGDGVGTRQNGCRLLCLQRWETLRQAQFRLWGIRSFCEDQELPKGLDSWGLIVVGSGLGLSVADLAVGILASFAPE